MNYEEYLHLREMMVEENSNLVGNVLNEKETLVDNYLKTLKQDLFSNISEDTIYKMNILKYSELYNNSLYDFFKKLPKGADLHVHAGALLPAEQLIDFVSSRNDLLIDINECRIYHISENYDSSKCYNLSYALDNNLLTKQYIINKWTILGKKHKENVWEYFENILDLFESIEIDQDVLYNYYVKAFEYYLSNNIYHIEIHAMLSKDFDCAYTLANTIKKAYFKVKETHNELIVSIICSGIRNLDVDIFVPELYLINAVKLRDVIKDDFDPNNIHEFIIGFDLLNEEDKSIPLKDLAPILLQNRELYPDFNLFIHCGESLQAQANNLIDAYLLGSTRVGHGLNLYRFPKLLEAFAKKEICLEACPISNKTLQYVKDLRLHPIAEYLKRGITISICSDDPTCQEHDSLVDDYFAGTVCWDLNLLDIKQLCINSIVYSGIDKSQKAQLQKTWKNAWDTFIEQIIKNLP